MEIKAKLILASQNKYTGQNLYTFILTYPRSILAEVNTHRMLSKNTSSSRAIPAKKFRARILHDPFIPKYIGMNQKGMQAGDELTGWKRWAAEKVISLARYPMVLTNYLLEKLNVHKQVINRYLEPWMWCEQLATGTDWKNILKLRNHKDAEPHFHELARQIQWAIDVAERTFTDMAIDGIKLWEDANCDYQVLDPDKEEWHTPFGDDLRGMPWDKAANISTARCARVSYYLPDGTSDIAKDLGLVERLSSSGHWSPFEHVAKPVKSYDYIGNFKGWEQYRKYFRYEAGGDR
jgi:hypothetical protein